MVLWQRRLYYSHHQRLGKEKGRRTSKDEIGSATEAVSFHDTLGEIRRVAKKGLSEDWVIPVGTVEMYEVIADFEEKIGSKERPTSIPRTRLWTGR